MVLSIHEARTCLDAFGVLITPRRDRFIASEPSPFHQRAESIRREYRAKSITGCGRDENVSRASRGADAINRSLRFHFVQQLLRGHLDSGQLMTTCFFKHLDEFVMCFGGPTKQERDLGVDELTPYARLRL